jgi:hypothetical protein
VDAQHTVTADDMESGRVIFDGFVFEGERVAGVFRWVRHRWPLVGWRTTNAKRAARQVARVERLKGVR